MPHASCAARNATFASRGPTVTTVVDARPICTCRCRALVVDRPDVSHATTLGALSTTSTRGSPEERILRHVSPPSLVR